MNKARAGFRVLATPQSQAEMNLSMTPSWKHTELPNRNRPPDSSPVPGPPTHMPALLARRAFSVHPIPFLLFSVGPFSPIKPAFCILKLNLFKDKQLESCFSGARVTDHMRGTSALRAADLAGPRLQGEASLWAAHCQDSKRHYSELQGGAVYQYRDLSPDAVATAAN